MILRRNTVQLFLLILLPARLSLPVTLPAQIGRRPVERPAQLTYTTRMEGDLEKIRDFADQAHGDQKRRYTPERYIVHPVRVMEICREYTAERPMLAAALLHDVLEDTPVGREEITRFLLTVMEAEEARRTVRLVEELTDVFVTSSYPRLNRRQRKTREARRLAKTSPDAQTIKYADIIDNSTEMVRHDPQFAKVFLHEGRALLAAMTNGDPQLYRRAISTVNDCLEICSAPRVTKSAIPAAVPPKNLQKGQ